MTGTAPIVENFRLTAALKLAALGWAVFPLHTPKIGPFGDPDCSCGKHDCASIGKHPRTPNGVKDATTNEARIRAWWKMWPDANVAVATGRVSGIVVIDIDPADGGNESFAVLLDRDEQWPETVQAETGGNGTHYVFNINGNPIGNSAGKLGPGIDVRGDGGYIVAPPSLHASNQRYVWSQGYSPEDIDPAIIPPWLVGKILEKPKPKTKEYHEPTTDETARHWLAQALAKSNLGNRNEVGFWLACQLRDAGLSESMASGVMRDYAGRCPQDGNRPAYTDREAQASLRESFKTSAREPAKSQARDKPPKPGGKPESAAGLEDAGQELSTYYEAIIAGEIYNAPFSFPQLTKFTQALLPGSMCCLVGDPGVGKTFLILQELQFWFGNGIPASVFFIEKDRKFHTMRLLAQLEGKGCFVDFEWIKANPKEVRAAYERHKAVVVELGKLIWSAPKERVTLDSLLTWIKERLEAKDRILVVDPLTAIAAGADRWTKDDDFVVSANHLLTKHSASLILVTHAKKGNRPGAPTLSDVAGGSAYSRFVDASIWLQRLKKPRHVRYVTPLGKTQGKFDLFFQLHKTRNGRGSGKEIAYTFGDGLQYAEQGLVIEDVKKKNTTDGTDEE